MNEERELVICGRTISDSSDCFVVAEIGHNHQGSLEKATEMFRVAKECGVDAVKLQKRDNLSLYTRRLYDQPYDHEHSFGSTYGQHREALEFGKKEYIELKHLAGELGLVFFATAFDLASVDFLEDLDVPAYKIASGDLLNTPLLKYVAGTGKPMFVSTGGGFLSDVQRAYDTIMPINSNICLMQCTSSYPCDPGEMNLKVITTYRGLFPEVVIGLSDHQNGIAMAEMSYVLGARVIEKHFTLSHAWKGTDHGFSLEPIGMKKMVRDLRRARAAMGDGVKIPFESEKKGLYKLAKKLVAARDIRAGEVLRVDDIAVKSPSDGLPPYQIDKVVGKVVLRDLKEDDNIVLGDLAEA
jgi:N-acetylneuraminate synthase/sialic acid synthase